MNYLLIIRLHFQFDEFCIPDIPVIDIIGISSLLFAYFVRFFPPFALQFYHE